MSNTINAHLQGVGNVEDVLLAVIHEHGPFITPDGSFSDATRLFANLLGEGGCNSHAAKTVLACLLNSLLSKSGRLWMVSVSGDLSFWPVSEGELRGVLVDLIA